MAIECKIIPWEDRQDIIDVVNSRKNSTMMKSSNPAVSEEFINVQINRIDVFEHNLVVGLYEDGILDCFEHMSIWSELPTYSHIAYTRFKEEGREKHSFNGKHDKNWITLINYAIETMEKKGYFNYYSLLQDTDWVPHTDNPDCVLSQYNRSIVEKIAPGTLSSSALFRHRLQNKIYNVPTQIVFCSANTARKAIYS